jgi:hypothetical protein
MSGGQAQQDYQDFIDRYDHGPPYDGIAGDEALQRHDKLAQELSAGDYQHAAQGAFSDLPHDDRSQLGQHLAFQAQMQGIQGPQLDGAAQGDPSNMGELAGMLHQQAPGMLGQLLGGSGQAGKGALAGIVANAARNFLG